MDHDMEQLQLISKNLGCKPPYWNSSSPLPLCTEQDQLKTAANRTVSLLLGLMSDSTLKPCRRFENMVNDYKDVATGYYNDNSTVTLAFNYKTPHYKELKGVKNMEFKTFVGN